MFGEKKKKTIARNIFEIRQTWIWILALSLLAYVGVDLILEAHFKKKSAGSDISMMAD